MEKDENFHFRLFVRYSSILRGLFIYGLCIKDPEAKFDTVNNCGERRYSWRR